MDLINAKRSDSFTIDIKLIFDRNKIQTDFSIADMSNEVIVF